MREPRPVIRAEVTEKNKTIRIIAAAVLLVVGIIALTSGFMKLLGKETVTARLIAAANTL